MSFMNMPGRIRPMTISSPAEGLSRSVSSRMRAALQRHAERQAYQDDPLVQATKRVRALMLDVSDAESRAVVEWERQNKPVATGLPREMHPDRLARVLAILGDHGLLEGDPLAPIVPTEPLEVIKARFTAEARAAYEDAQAVVMILEGRTGPDPVEDDANESVALAVEGVSSEADIVSALDREGALDGIVIDDDVPVLPQRRGPGRPSKLERAIGAAVIDNEERAGRIACGS